MKSARQKQDPATERLADQWLVLEAQRGEAESFRLLAERWQERLWRHAYRVTQREALAWDVSQEAWLVIARHLGRLGDPRKFGSWALSIVTRRALDAMRKAGRVDALEDPATEVLEVTVEAPPPGSPLERMGRALAVLPAPQRTLLALHHVEGLALEEIAGVLAVPVGTVKSRLHTAREALRDTLERMKP